MLGKTLSFLLILQSVSGGLDPDSNSEPKPDPDPKPKPKPWCAIPREIENGEFVEEVKSEDPVHMVKMAKYKCNEGYMMIETWKGDIGWCRYDKTYELPRCVTKDKWIKVEFELVAGKSKMKNAGRVKARYIFGDGSKGDWHVGCNDHMNNPAAGAICRTMGFRYGRQIQPDRKMKPIENLAFGVTNIYCYHDDTLPTSLSCNVDDYNKMAQKGWPLCVPEEQATVHCFDDWWKVDVGFGMSKRSGKMFCPVQVIKEGTKQNLKDMNVQVKWGGVKGKKEGGYDVTFFQEGVHYQPIGGFSKKRGFGAKIVGDKSDYDCYFCTANMDGHLMNIKPDKNHNCPKTGTFAELSLGCAWYDYIACAGVITACGAACCVGACIEEPACPVCLGGMFDTCKDCF